MVNTKEFLKIIENANKWRHDINYGKQPLKYEVTNDCGGMYTCEPYKAKFLQVWKFSTTKAAFASAKSIKRMFLDFLACEDFVGADLAKKYLRAGSTRDSVPKSSRKIFKEVYDEVSANSDYDSLKKLFLEKQAQEQAKNEKR